MTFEEWFDKNYDNIDHVTVINGIYTNAEHLKEMFKKAWDESERQTYYTDDKKKDIFEY